MTAAALKPPLFSNLIATRPGDGDQHSLAPTLLSVAFHASLVAVAVWATSRIREFTPPREIETVVPITVAAPSDQTQQPLRGGGGNRPSSGPELRLPNPNISAAPPISDLPVPGGNEFAVPGDPAPTQTPPGPGGSGGGEGSQREGFTILSTMPALLNAVEVRKALTRAYPPLLRDAGIGGKAQMWLLLDVDGSVIKAELKESSGQAALDDVAMRIAPLMRFTPAMNRDQRVKVWVSVPIVFRTN